MGKDKLKPWPSLPTDEAAEAFVDRADLGEYDWGLAEPVTHEFARKDARVNMRMPERQLARIKDEAANRGIGYQRFMRELLERGMATLR